MFAERIKEAIADWSSATTNRKGQKDQIKQNDLEWQIYDLLGSACLTPDVVDYLREMLVDESDWEPLDLFDRLNRFWENWCEGEFIDRLTDNLPQKKMKILAEQMPDRETLLGIRQVDVYTGLNILILLLELHRYAQSRDELKDSIVFYPSGNSQPNRARLLKIIHYSESISIDTFNKNLLSFLRDAKLSGADLNHADLRGADLRGADLRGADLSYADLSHADLRGGYISDANFSSANLNSLKWDDNLDRWKDVRGLADAIDLPEAIKQHLVGVASPSREVSETPILLG